MGQFTPEVLSSKTAGLVFQVLLIRGGWSIWLEGVEASLVSSPHLDKKADAPTPSNFAKVQTRAGYRDQEKKGVSH